MLKTSRYDDAKDIASRHFSDKDPAQKLFWMSKAQKTYSRMGEHKTVIDICSDILTLANTLKQPSYNMVVFDMFASAVSTDNINAMIESAKIIESLYPSMPEALFVYKEMIKYGLRKNDNMTALNYAKKMYDLQRKLKVYNDTPWLEFTYSELLSKNSDTNGALLALASLRDKKLSPNDKARQLYNASVLWQKIGKKDTAKKLLEECSRLKDDSSWRKLCKDGLELF
jgi:predicted Zn-dependent protease